MPVSTAAARMMFSGICRVTGGAIALPMVQPRHIMMANGQSTEPRMMNMTAAEMFAPNPTTVFSALIWWNGPILPKSRIAKASVPAAAPK